MIRIRVCYGAWYMMTIDFTNTMVNMTVCSYDHGLRWRIVNSPCENQGITPSSTRNQGSDTLLIPMDLHHPHCCLINHQKHGTEVRHLCFSTTSCPRLGGNGEPPAFVLQVVQGILQYQGNRKYTICRSFTYWKGIYCYAWLPEGSDW